MTLARAGVAVIATAVALTACRGSLSPLSNRIGVGKDSYVVFVADGENGFGDLFASGPGGGVAWQFTFTRVDEQNPALSPDGSMVAFLRTRSPDDTTDLGLVFFNLLNGAERRVDLPGRLAQPMLAQPALVAWNAAGDTVYLRSAAGMLQTPAPPARPALRPVTNLPHADSAFLVPLGHPPVGAVVACVEGPGLCASLNGETVPLAAAGSAPVAWAGDSVAFVEQGELVVRPLAGGQTRAVRWTSGVSHPREWSWFGGANAAARQ